MALNIKNAEVERLAADVARLAGESKTEAIRLALAERKARLAFRVAQKDRQAAIRRVLERDVWPRVPKPLQGRRLSKREEDAILGYGAKGV